MLSRTNAAALSAVVLALGVGATASASTGHHSTKAGPFSSSKDPVSVSMTEKTVKATYVNVGRKDQAVGDESIISDALVFHHQVIGSDAVVCTMLNKHRGQCLVTLSFKNTTDTPDTMTVQGVFDDRHAHDLFAVTGGTGAFVGTVGQVDRVPLSNTKARLDFTVMIPPAPVS